MDIIKWALYIFFKIYILKDSKWIGKMIQKIQTLTDPAYITFFSKNANFCLA